MFVCCRVIMHWKLVVLGGVIYFMTTIKIVVCLVFLDEFWQWWHLVEMVVGGTYEWEHAKAYIMSHFPKAKYQISCCRSV